MVQACALAGRRPPMTKSSSQPRVVISNNGPYLVSGGVPLAKQTIVTDREGESQQWRQGETLPARESYQLCRCGKSKTKPFCDGTHAKIGFDGTETAPRTTYREQAQVLEGPALALTDAQSLCAGARFCDPNGQVWNQVERTEEAGLRTTFLRQVNNCPSGRLVAWDRATGKPIEHALPVSIGLIEDPDRKSTRLNSSHSQISYAVFCLKKKKQQNSTTG